MSAQGPAPGSEDRQEERAGGVGATNWELSERGIARTRCVLGWEMLTWARPIDSDSAKGSDARRHQGAADAGTRRGATVQTCWCNFQLPSGVRGHLLLWYDQTPQGEGTGQVTTVDVSAEGGARSPSRSSRTPTGRSRCRGRRKPCGGTCRTTSR